MADKLQWLKRILMIVVVTALVWPLGGYGISHSVHAQMPWVGRVVSTTQDLSLRGSVLRVSVVGMKGLPVKVSSGSWSAVGLTGSKPEVGPFASEFAMIPSGKVLIEPQGLNASLTITADKVSYITVEFTQGLLATATPVSLATPAATVPVVATPTPSPIIVPATATLLPTFTPQPEIKAPTPSLPTPAPATALPPAPTATAGPAPVTVWFAKVTYVAQGPEFSYSTIVVRVLGMSQLPVEIHTGAFQATAATGSKPEYGGFAAEFGGLGAGNYVVAPKGLGTTIDVRLERGQTAFVDFNPVLASPTPISTPAALVTMGAGATAEATATGTPFPEATTTLTEAITSTVFYLPPAPTPTWMAHVTERISGVAAGRLAVTIVVRVLGARNLPVIVDSGGWQARALTGTKPEYGDFAAEFGGLPAGEYDILPEGLNLRYKVSADRGEFLVVDFTYQVPPAPTPGALAFSSDQVLTSTASLGASEFWSGRVISQSSDSSSVARDEASIVVRVPNVGMPIEVRSAESWKVFSLSDRKSGLDSIIARFDHLAPGTYQVLPQGLGTWVELDLEGGVEAWVEFAPQ